MAKIYLKTYIIKLFKLIRNQENINFMYADYQTIIFMAYIFTYLGSSVSSTEKDIDTRLTKAWIVINRLSIIWKSDLTYKMKRSFFKAAVALILLNGCTTWTLTVLAGEEARRQLQKNTANNLEQVLAATPHKTPTVRPPASYHENYSS